MEQTAYHEMTRMLDSFPQTSGNPDMTVSAYELAVDGLPPTAIIEASQRFISGLVEGQSDDFAPAAPRFAKEVRRIADLLPYRGKSISKPRPYFYQEPKAGEKVRMGFKLAVLSASFGRANGADMVMEAHKRGLEDMIALGQSWGVPVPDELWAQLGKTAA